MLKKVDNDGSDTGILNPAFCLEITSSLAAEGEAICIAMTTLKKIIGQCDNIGPLTH